MPKLAGAALFTALVALGATPSVAEQGRGEDGIAIGVPTANQRVGHPDDVIAPGFALNRVATGLDPIENPSGIITRFGYLNDPTVAGDPTTGTTTEPDENTFLVLDRDPGGPTPNFDYGRRFLFQGHEVFGLDMAYITRINLDVNDPKHRITLLTPVGADEKTHLNDLDGSVFNPFTGTLLFSSENGNGGGVFELPVAWPPTLKNLDGIIGKAGFEGMKVDDRGNILIIEDTGGTSVSINPNDANASPKVARQPNSFVYRFVPKERTNLSLGGKMQALQATIDGQPVIFGNDAFADTWSPVQVKLHTLGSSYPMTWVTIHDTDVDGFAAFDANLAAKAAKATPFKRPENVAFLPDGKFRTFFFCPTGDTSSVAGNVPGLAARGAWGSIFRVDLDATRDKGRLAIFALGDADHAAFDNLYFLDDDTLLATEDRGDGLHGQLNLLDSIWAYPVDGTAPKRFLALGRDPNSNDGGDNEPTGIMANNGSPTRNAMVGTKDSLKNARAFFTQQHGQNNVWEILAQDEDDDHGHGKNHH
jgi:hypothetical protein